MRVVLSSVTFCYVFVRVILPGSSSSPTRRTFFNVKVHGSLNEDSAVAIRGVPQQNQEPKRKVASVDVWGPYQSDEHTVSIGK